MERQVQQLNNQISNTYVDMKNIPYYLHAICVHDGSAQSGHYYAFIYDRFQKKWRKYNDIRVTDVSEEEVFEQSQGGKGFASAYWVVYIN